MREAAGGANARRVVRRGARTHPAFGKSLYVVELSRRRLDAGRSRPPARSHLGIACTQGERHGFPDHPRCPRLATAVRPRAGHGDAGCVGPWSGQVISLAPAIRISLAIWLVRLANSSRSRRAAAGSLSSTRCNMLRATRTTEECWMGG